MAVIAALSSQASRLATEAQRQAADPLASVWVSASAGSGKTKVLTDRILSLLLSGTPPQRLLALTFTKAAAAEMSKRLALRLGSWAMAEEEVLEGELAVLLGRPASAEERTRARELFAAVLDAPGGIKLMTIHAFCQSLLARFPLEAGVAPTAKVMDDREAADLLEQSRGEVLTQAAEDPTGALARAIDQVASRAHETTFSELLSALVRERASFSTALARYKGLPGLVDRLRHLLDLRADDDASSLMAALCAEQVLDRPKLMALADALAASGGKRDQEKAQPLYDWLAAEPDERPALLPRYMGIFFKSDQAKALEDRWRKNPLSKALLESLPDALATYQDEAERLQAGLEKLNALAVLEANQALFRLAQAVLQRYEARKQAAALLDYDDLILKARRLLQQEAGASWILFKLDGGLDHLLIDEGQDTNPDQWAVARALSEEFFTGEGGREDLRTVFVVGDAKQSIYSFQRADPQAFQAMRRVFAEKVRAAGQLWRDVSLAVSFRSTEAVLQAVDATFAEPAARKGVLFDEVSLQHIPNRVGQPGVVELWPPAPAAPKLEREAWSLPLAEKRQAPGDLRLARFLAAQIKYWTLDPAGADDPACRLTSRDRRMEPQDIVILVRRRNAFFEALVRALKTADVPVAGVDRMVLTEQLAVMDLMALGRVMLLPEDDLTLATVLKGPFFGIDEETLFSLAYDRPASLWQALEKAAKEGPGASEAIIGAWSRLTQWRARADFQPPYEFFGEILGPYGGRRQILARLGPEALDAVDEFLAQALAFGRQQTASLEGFLHWLEQSTRDIKRDLEQAKDSVRVMTVHGAKGLQAPVVLLPDSMQVTRPQERLFWLEERDQERLPLWPVKRSFDGPLAIEARDANREALGDEYRRLLYVAMTRAEDRLIVCGWEGTQRAPDDCWYHLVSRGLQGCGEQVEYDFRDRAPEGWFGEGHRLLGSGDAGPDHLEKASNAPASAPPLPSWAGRPAPEEPSPPLPLAPSRPQALDPASLSPMASPDKSGLRRGLLMHRLLQDLPALSDTHRAEAGQALLRAQAGDLPSEQRGEMVQEVLQVLDAPDLSALFGPGSQAEVPVGGLVETDSGPAVVSGRIDRLLIRENEVLILDFKTGRPVPQNEDEVAPAYLRQLAGYRALLAQIFDDRTVHCALLWTDGPRFLTISPALLARHAP